MPSRAFEVGRLQFWLEPEVFEKHIALDSDALQRAHESAQLEVLACEYLLFANFAVVNLNGSRRDARRFLRRLARPLLRGVTVLIWMAEDLIGHARPNALTSPYIVSAATWLSAREAEDTSP